MVRALLEKNADPFPKNHEGLTCTDYMNSKKIKTLVGGHIEKKGVRNKNRILVLCDETTLLTKQTGASIECYTNK